MLLALCENGNRITPALLKKQDLYVLRNQVKFYCPVCKAHVILKIGQKMIPHFAHKSVGKCLIINGGEGSYHEKGKLLLYNWLKSLNIDVELEKYIPEINRQPDLFIKINQKRIAIEYQCARIDIEELKNRMNDYKKAGIEQIWILGGNRFQKIGNQHYKIDEYTRMFIHHFCDLDPVLYYFCSNTKNFIKLHNIYLTSSNRAIAKTTIKKLFNLHLLDLFLVPKNDRIQSLTNWKTEKRLFRLRESRRSHSDEFKWKQWLYLNGLHIETLPSSVFLPISNQYKMKTNLWNWQSRLLLALYKSNDYPFFNLKQCHHILKSHLNKRISLLQIEKSDPIEEYIKLLTEIGICTRQKKNLYQFKKKIKTYRNVEEAIIGDELFISKTIHAIKQINLK